MQTQQLQLTTTCVACGGELSPDNGSEPTSYQFENALWLGFHGGYGMFVDNLGATMPTNTDERWLRDDSGEYRLNDGQPIVNPDWKPTYGEPRVLPGTPDYEAVICHECAHDLCEKVPWIKTLLDPDNSHSHRITSG